MLLSGQAEFLAVYGHRRVGKTFLLRQYLKNNLVFDFAGTKDGIKEAQLYNFYEEYLKRVTGKKGKPIPSSWQEAFNYLKAYLKNLPIKKQKHVVFINEMPWLDIFKADFIAALEFFWNQHASNINLVLIIECGSASSLIKKKLISARGGLYNLVTQRIQLMPFNLYETELFLNRLHILKKPLLLHC